MNKKENKPQEEAKTQDKSQNQPKESFVGTGNGSSLRSRTGSWFECKVRYAKTQDDGSEKMVNELYVVDALSFTEAEASIIDNMQVYASGEFKVANINPTNYNEIFFSDIDDDDFGLRHVWLSSPLTRRATMRSVPMSTISSKPSASSVQSVTLTRLWAKP